MTADQLSSLDLAFLCLERPEAPMHLGAVGVFRPAERAHPVRLSDLLAQRAAGVPRLRQRVRPTWFPPGGAAWFDDPGFDAAGHIHLHRLAGSAGRDQLSRQVSAAMARPLDRSRPLWEIHLFTGLQGGQFAVLTKLHHALADGLRAVEIGVLLLDGVGAARPAGGMADPSAGAGVPRPGGLPAAGLQAAWRAVRAASGALARPDRLLGPAASAAAGLPALVRRTTEAAGIAASVLGSAAPPSANSPLAANSPRQAPGSPRRRMALLRIDLEDIHRIRRRHGGTVHDVLLAVVTGALRQWLRSRGHPLDGLTLRALIPVSRLRPAGRDGVAGNELSGYLCDLPVGESDPVARLRALRAQMDQNKTAGAARGAGAIPVLADRLPPAVHRVAGPLAALCAPLLFDTVITTVPLPNLPLRLAGAELAEIYPVVPLAHGHSLGIGVSTYRGTAYVTLHADQQAMPDLGRLAATVPAAVGALDRMPRAS